MNFNIDAAPPGQDILEQERKFLASEIRRLTLRDTIVTFFIIILCSALLFSGRLIILDIPEFLLPSFQ